MRRGVTSSGACAAVLLAIGCLLTTAGGALGQGTLLELGAVNDARNEMIRGGNNNNQRNQQAQPAQTPAQGGAADAGEGSDGEADTPATPSVKLDKWNDEHSIYRKSTPAAAWWKLLLVGLVVLAWTRSGDWVSRDAHIYGLGHENWNTIMAAPFLLGFLGLLLIPNFWGGLAALVLSWVVPFGLYVGHHNKSVEAHESVFTSDWFRFQLASFGKLLGLKVGTEKTAGYMRGPQVDLEARGGDEDRVNQANLLTARQSPGYVHVKELIADMTARGSSRAILDYTSEMVSVRHMIDGVWHNGEPRDRESGDVMLAVMKQLTNLEVGERNKKQEGEFGAEYQKSKYNCFFSSQGVKSGERVIVSLKGRGLNTDFETLEQLGMREKIREQWLEVMGLDRGVVVISAMPEGGLTTLTDVSLLDTDRLMRDFFAIEEVSEPQADIENIQPFFYDAAKGESPAKLIPSLSRKYPNVYVCRDFVDEESAKLLMDEVDLDRLVITNVHAGDVAEACLRVLKKKTPHKPFVRDLAAVLNTRLIRKLCTACRIEYEATPALLKKLGIPSGKVTRFYRSPKAEEIDKPCKVCAGLGFMGRTALYELLIPDDQFRQKLLKEPKIDVLRKAARKAGMRTLQEEGVLLVAKGVTSLPELQRVLKG